ncbi:uncharacterized protein LOC104892887 isoform X2 [Beta vulgaris subsp. vulgaris]|uniref:uncharacterized protein LOC104892887 isoform X2 n=1 Tax=Beta vulgaris subsp. vulgaris TaxID=3555 RepID=UPI0020373960|nr:uncharacterized protein LOC104892887 isoform X2 [Beta vulgaris subsp. vulgaris]
MRMPSVFCQWYLYRFLLLSLVLFLVLSGVCGWYVGGDNGFEFSLSDNAVPILGNSSGENISGYEDTSNFMSLSVNLVSCEDLEGVGSFNTTCVVNSHVHLNSSIYAFGTGNLEILPHVSIVCPIEGCSITFNVSGNVKVGPNAAVMAGSVVISAHSLSFGQNSSVNTTALGGRPPPQTSGTPFGYEGAGGGHGGRGASCLRNEQRDAWGGDVYSWSNVSRPWSYGSKGSGKSTHKPFGGMGGGRVKLIARDELYLNGSVTAEGGDGGVSGGGGSGGSIIINSYKLKGIGTISAAGGRGWGGGGGGRISLHCYSVQDVEITVHGGLSIGCPENAGAAGTYFDATLLSLRVGNDNISTETETPLLDFSTSPLWSKVFVENSAKALVPLLWTRVQLRGQISVLSRSSINFGLKEHPISEFELVAEELLMSDSNIQVYGALRVIVKMLLMWNSEIQIDGGKAVVTTSVLEVRNLAVLREHSVISSNTNLALYGQGLLKLTGDGDVIRSQRLLLSQFYNITLGRGSLLQAPLDNNASKTMVTKSLCENQTCPMDLISPPDDCHINSTTSFSLQICRVEDILVGGLVKGSIIHFHRARTIVVSADGMLTASELGCRRGIGMGRFSNGVGSGAGHGGKGGPGMFNGTISEGGSSYGNACLPCELGSGSEGPNESYGHVAGGGMIVIGAKQWPLFRLDLYGSLRADGQGYSQEMKNSGATLIGSLGGGSGGTILLFLQKLILAEQSNLSAAGGKGGPLGGGGGGGGRIHFHWSDINTGDEYVPIAVINGTIYNRGGAGNSSAYYGEEGTITGKDCPKGLYGTFCSECPIGTFKDIDGSDEHFCAPCPQELLPHRAEFIYVRGGVSQPSCPYKCISDKYRMPHCFTPLEELMYPFGGPWPFSLLLLCCLVALGLLLNLLRIKMVGSSSVCHGTYSFEQHQFDCQYPHLLSLSEVKGPSRTEETQSHIYRMYFMGPNTFREPWHLPYTPPDEIVEIVYEDAFNRFIDEINSIAAYDWWEGSVHSILIVLAYPCAWSWKQWRRRIKIQRLQEYVKSEYDHSCLRSCRARALYKGMKVGGTPDLMVAYIDFFLGGDEKRVDIASIIQKRFPLCIIFGGDGSYMSPYSLHSDALLTNLIAQHVPTSVWSHLVAGLNAQLRTVRHGFMRSTLVPLIYWINSHANPQLEFHGVRIDLGWFHATSSGYNQLGMWVVVDDCTVHNNPQPVSLNINPDESPRRNGRTLETRYRQLQQSQSYTSQVLSRRRTSGLINGALINDATLKSLEFRRDIFFIFSLFLRNTRPVSCQDTVQLLILIIILADLSVTCLMLVQFYWISLGAFLAVLLILPLSLLSPFPAGLNAVFSKGHRRASLARMYALWNATSLSSIAVAFISGIFYYTIHSVLASEKEYARNAKRDDDAWWLLPSILLLLKCIQARFVDWHLANLEISDSSLLTPDPDAFWAHES